MAIRTQKDRRKLNLRVAQNQRGTKMDRRLCPDCGRLVMGRIKSARGGTVQFSRCAYCGWESKKSKQVDEGLAEILLSFDGRIDKAGKKLWMELDPAVLDAAGYKGRKKLHFKAVVIAGPKPRIRWIVE
jgi:predicted RNA-binding Zn-ribbon protein involved in translation (DUF1610 family)